MHGREELGFCLLDARVRLFLPLSACMSVCTLACTPACMLVACMLAWMSACTCDRRGLLLYCPLTSPGLVAVSWVWSL